MQNAFNTGAAFKLETLLPIEMLVAHNSRDIEEYRRKILEHNRTPDSFKFLKSDSSGNISMTFYAQELLELASAEYAIRCSPPGHQVAMPRTKAAVLEAISMTPQAAKYSPEKEENTENVFHGVNS